MKNKTAEVFRSVAELLDRIVHKIDVEERSMFDDDVITLVEEINFTELARLLHVAAETQDQMVEIITALDWQGAKWLADRLRTTQSKLVNINAQSP